MSFGIPISNDHSHIAADTFRSQSSLRKTGRHREEIDQSVIFSTQDAGHLSIRNIHIIDRNITHFTIRQFGNFLHNRNRLSCIGREYIITEA